MCLHSIGSWNGVAGSFGLLLHSSGAKIAYFGYSGQDGLVGRGDGPVSMTADTCNEIKGAVDARKGSNIIVSMMHQERRTIQVSYSAFQHALSRSEN